MIFKNIYEFLQFVKAEKNSSYLYKNINNVITYKFNVCDNQYVITKEKNLYSITKNKSNWVWSGKIWEKMELYFHKEEPNLFKYHIRKVKIKNLLNGK